MLRAVWGRLRATGSPEAWRAAAPLVLVSGGEFPSYVWLSRPAVTPASGAEAEGASQECLRAWGRVQSGVQEGRRASRRCVYVALTRWGRAVLGSLRYGRA